MAPERSSYDTRSDARDVSGPLDLLTAPLRSLLGASEQDVVKRSPLHEAGELEGRLDEAVSALHRAADSMERHVAVVETLAQSVPALTDSVNALVRELNGLLTVVAPIEGAEREVSRVEHFFGRRKRSDEITPAGGAGEPPPGGPDVAGG